MPVKVGIITVSDSCSDGTSKDKSGIYLMEAVKKTFPNVDVNYCVVPDDESTIVSKLISYADDLSLNLIITTGGTGFTQRDVTPEATKKVIFKLAPNIMTVICMKSYEKTEMAMLSRGISGIRNKSIIINLPGSLKAVEECYEMIQNVLPHAIDQVSDNLKEVKSFHTNKMTNKSSGHCHHHKSSNETGGDALHVAYRKRQSTYPMISVEKAFEMLVESVKDSIKPESIPIKVGLICMQDVRAPEDYPPFRASIKDGYACISSDGVGVRKVKSAVTAGELPDSKITSGECFRVSTGAPVPDGADCVVQVEDTKLLKHSEDGTVEYEIEIMTKPKCGQDIRDIGSDISKNEVILCKNSYIGPAEYGLLNSFGIKSICGVKRLRIGVLSTGNEVKDSNDDVQGGCIRDSNRPMLFSLLSDYGECVDLGIAKDDRDELYTTLLTAYKELKCDIIITSGGVSMGEKDHLKDVLMNKLSFQVLFGRVNMKPGKPTTFAAGSIDSMKKFIFGLPGNPVSAYVTCNLFVIPTLKAMMGMKEIHWAKITVELNEDVVLDPRPEYARGTFKLGVDSVVPIATITGNQISSRLTSLVGAQILLQLPGASEEKPILLKKSYVPALLIKNI